MIGLALVSIWFLFFWEPKNTSGALLDIVVQFYRPVLWIVLVVVLLALLAPAVGWLVRRGPR